MLRRIKGMDNISKKTHFIIISNHDKLVDPLLILYVVLRKLNRKVHFLAAPSWWFLGDTICRKWAGCIPLFDSKQSYEEMKKHVAKNKIVGIFPEGHMKKRNGTPRTGALRLALETNTPILPIGIHHNKGLLRSNMSIGKLFFLKKNKESQEKQMKEIMKIVYNLRDSS